MDATKIFWWWCWRALLSGILSGLVIGFSIGLIGAFLSVEQGTVIMISTFVGALWGFFVSIYFMKKLLETKLDKFYQHPLGAEGV
jgi:flagellar biosynthesis protein FliQ